MTFSILSFHTSVHSLDPTCQRQCNCKMTSDSRCSFSWSGQNKSSPETCHGSVFMSSTNYLNNSVSLPFSILITINIIIFIMYRPIPNSLESLKNLLPDRNFDSSHRSCINNLYSINWSTVNWLWYHLLPNC